MSPERFWSKVARGEPDTCWEWQGRRRPDGYGVVSWAGRDTVAHRVACALAHGRIPERRVVMHACDNPPCCNPAHLSIGTIDANNLDMLAKGRYRPSTGDATRGTLNVHAKLTDALVAELRAAWRAGESIKSICLRTGLSVGAIHPMLHGRTWRHVGWGSPLEAAPARAARAPESSRRGAS